MNLLADVITSIVESVADVPSFSASLHDGADVQQSLDVTSVSFELPLDYWFVGREQLRASLPTTRLLTGFLRPVGRLRFTAEATAR